MEKRKVRLVTAALCALVAIGGIGALVVPAVAVGECSCKIEVHGSNCPLSRCTCEGKTTGEHEDGCPLAEVNADLTACVCEPEVHAQGCPRYQGEDEDNTTVVDLASPEGGADQGLDSSEPESGTDAGSSAGAAGEGSGEVAAGDTAEGDAGSAGDDGSEEGGADGSTGSSGGSGEAAGDAAGGDSADGAQTPTDPEAAAEEVELEPMETEVPDDLDAMEDGWEYPSGWSGYGDGQMDGNLQAAAEFSALDIELDDRVQEIAGVLTNGENARMAEVGGGLGDVLAVYATLTGQTDRYPYEVYFDGEDEQALFRSVYWSMTQVTGVSNADGAVVSVRHLTADEGADLYDMSEDDAQLALDLAQKNDVVQTIVDESIFASLSEEELAEVLELVPDDISVKRRSVLLAAVSLVGKVDYFWGGKSLAYGWDDRWGEIRTVASAGSSTTGTALPLGLDCSGFVSWAFLNAYGSSDAMGGGTSGQWYSCAIVPWEDAQPGDLVFYYDPSAESNNHVGIVLSVGNSGPETVVHCSTGGVQISGPYGFSYVGRPAAYAS